MGALDEAGEQGHGNVGQVDREEEPRSSLRRGEPGEDTPERPRPRDEIRLDRQPSLPVAEPRSAQDADVAGHCPQAGDRVVQEVGPLPGEERLVAPHPPALAPGDDEPDDGHRDCRPARLLTRPSASRRER